MSNSVKYNYFSDEVHFGEYAKTTLSDITMVQEFMPNEITSVTPRKRQSVEGTQIETPIKKRRVCILSQVDHYR